MRETGVTLPAILSGAMLPDIVLLRRVSLFQWYRLLSQQYCVCAGQLTGSRNAVICYFRLQAYRLCKTWQLIPYHALSDTVH